MALMLTMVTFARHPLGWSTTGGGIPEPPEVLDAKERTFSAGQAYHTLVRAATKSCHFSAEPSQTPENKRELAGIRIFICGGGLAACGLLQASTHHEIKDTYLTPRLEGHD
jgi:hypothetical protein